MAGAVIMKAVLLVNILAMVFLAIFYLRRRQLGWAAYCFWGLLAIVLPVLGPFLVIASRPGRWRAL
jgi:chromate transport protein ChrA